ncbi:lincosamide nucleotidyltransferase A/C/D/E [Allocatelliglobosispora scoriae]|uniref:Lincosamide nucleotidyltransferase A/C/D/E n=1 Tax=Allocatelliglobosispora scoriae TaxID=643052 RepID=A0A841BMX8_9ACTN|nr:aminoglycoside adenylyltransferase [Allocatelliglobosispora scoriae]MBB5868323.1 lincosamide nucleotidyltransferase A/C/D/E [Allocatelliglobosispora scoriae]
MDISDVMAVIAALDAEGVRHWVAGGWGVDALVGRQTRPHRDLDLAVDAADEATALRALARLGYSIETDQRPARVEVAAAGARWVDLHPVRFNAIGWGRQADLSGGSFTYPPAAFDAGVLADRAVGCLSASQQLCFRTGYELRDVDRHDITLLTALL